MIKVCEYQYCDNEVKGMVTKRFCSRPCVDRSKNGTIPPEYRDPVRICEYQYCDEVVKGDASARFCSRKCAERSRRNIVAPSGIRICEYQFCDNEFIGPADKRFCSTSCKNKMRAGYREVQICEYQYCDNEFIGPPAGKRFCSKSCGARAGNGTIPAPLGRICEYQFCDNEVEGLSHKRFCSPLCRRRAQRSRRSGSRRLRLEILQRDNFTCIYCGSTAEDGAKLHADHIVPISKGGADAADNMIAACERCNMGKSSQELEASQAAHFQALARRRNQEQGLEASAVVLRARPAARRWPRRRPS